jgi:hypothetical protein
MVLHTQIIAQIFFIDVCAQTILVALQPGANFIALFDKIGEQFQVSPDGGALAADGAANNIDANDSIVTDPVMVADTTAEPNTNMHLQVTSPCRNIGVTGLGITTDYDSVPQGATPDIGAYKYV